eukprot:Nk52_evm1s1930 gene=Nk52_evmTU1s1930
MEVYMDRLKTLGAEAYEYVDRLEGEYAMKYDFKNAPLTSWQALVGMGAGYVVFITLLERVMKNRAAFSCQFAVMLHNTFLALASLVMFLGVTKNLVTNMGLAKWDFTLLVCDEKHVLDDTKRMDMWNYIFYMSKYFEFIDTVFLILKKRDVIFLHWYHHMITPSIVWFAWLRDVTAAWYGPFTNTFVHVFMYAYYAATYFGFPRKFGGYVTKIQIFQFMSALAIFGVAGINNFLCKNCKNQSLEGWAFVYIQYVFFLYLFTVFSSKRKAKFVAPKKDQAPAEKPMVAKKE